MNEILNVIIYMLCISVGVVVTGIVSMTLVTMIVYFFRKDDAMIRKNNN